LKSNNIIKISAVEYLNTLPFVHGINNSGFLKNYLLELDIPSACAEKMLAQKADIGLVPIVSLTKLKDYQIITDYCIGAISSVGSVLLLSDVPIEKIKCVMLDYHSQTTNSLIKVILSKYMNISVLWENGNVNYEKRIAGNNAGIVIGDRAFEMIGKHRYSYDLARLWNQYTGLPFVFACWVAIGELPKQVLDDFCKAIDWGVKHKFEAAKNVNSNINLENYFNNCISYDFDQDKKDAMELFFKEVRQLNIVGNSVG